jgi:hypothetical protein
MSQPSILHVKAGESRSPEKSVKLTPNDTQGAYELLEQHLRGGRQCRWRAD